jgi:ribosomal protein S18 acetylase RimI-like enzyme
VISYRKFLNSDPPGLVDVWNDTANGRGSYPLRSVSLFDRWILSKPYFEADGLIVAEEINDEGKKSIVGFTLAGFGPNEEQTGLNHDLGVTCNILVKHSYRKSGVGRELLKRSEAYLISKGAKTLHVGSMNPNNPFLFGLHGGANSPGILKSDGDAEPFLTKEQYTPGEAVTIFQRKLDSQLNIVDNRFNFLKRRYDVQLIRAAQASSWWAECVWGVLEPVEFRIFDKLTGMPCARAIVWELEGFNWRWNYPAAGILDVQVRPDLRKQGMAKMLLFQILRFLQDQFFGIAELQVRSADPAAVGLCTSLGFEAVDEGFVYIKSSIVEK